MRSVCVGVAGQVSVNPTPEDIGLFQDTVKKDFLFQTCRDGTEERD